MRSRLLKPLLATLVCLAAWSPGSAPAAATWSWPQAIAGSAPLELLDPGVAFTQSGEGVAAWISTPENPEQLIAAPWPSVSGSFEPGRLANPRIGLDVGGANFALYGRSRIAAGGTKGSGDISRAAVALGRIGGVLGKPRVVGPALDTAGVKLAATARGDLALVMLSVRPTAVRRSIPYLVVRAAGGRFTRPIRLARGGDVTGVDLAIDARGDVLVAWALGGRIEARFRTAGGRLGHTQVLGRTERVPVLSAALTSRGRATVVWESQRRSEQRALSDTRVVATVARRRGRFGNAQTLETFAERVSLAGCEGTAETLALAAYGSKGHGLVAWTGREGGRFVVRAADLAGARYGAPQTVSPHELDACLGDLATGPHGEGIVIWSQADLRRIPVNPPDRAVVAAVRSELGRPFGAPEQVADDVIFAPRVAFDPRTGRAIAVWLGSAAVSFSTRPPIATSPDTQGLGTHPTHRP